MLDLHGLPLRHTAFNTSYSAVIRPYFVCTADTAAAVVVFKLTVAPISAHFSNVRTAADLAHPIGDAFRGRKRHSVPVLLYPTRHRRKKFRAPNYCIYLGVLVRYTKYEVPCTYITIVRSMYSSYIPAIPKHCTLIDALDVTTTKTNRQPKTATSSSSSNHNPPPPCRVHMRRTKIVGVNYSGDTSCCVRVTQSPEVHNE